MLVIYDSKRLISEMGFSLMFDDFTTFKYISNIASCYYHTWCDKIYKISYKYEIGIK